MKMNQRLKVGPRCPGRHGSPALPTAPRAAARRLHHAGTPGSLQAEGKGPLRTQTLKGLRQEQPPALTSRQGRGPTSWTPRIRQQPGKNQRHRKHPAAQAGLCSGHAIYPSPSCVSTLKSRRHRWCQHTRGPPNAPPTTLTRLTRQSPDSPAGLSQRCSVSRPRLGPGSNLLSYLPSSPGSTQPPHALPCQSPRCAQGPGPHGHSPSTPIAAAHPQSSWALLLLPTINTAPGSTCRARPTSQCPVC